MEAFYQMVKDPSHNGAAFFAVCRGKVNCNRSWNGVSSQCVYVCVCVVCMVAVWCSGCVLGSGPEVPEFKPNSGNLPSDFPSASHQPHQSTQLWLGTWHLLGCKFKAFSHETAMVQVGLRVPTPLAVRKGLFSCEFLAWLQELCLHSSQCLLSAQASWLCQVCITASSCKRICIFCTCYVYMHAHQAWGQML